MVKAVALHAAKLWKNSAHNHLSGEGPREPMLENWPVNGQDSTSIFSGPLSINTCPAERIHFCFLNDYNKW